MGGGGTNTTTATQTSAPTNPDVQATASKLAKGISAQYDKGPQVFNESTFSPAGATTQDAWGKAIAAANNGDYTGGVNGAIKSFGDTASGKFIGQNDPGYQTIRAKLQNDVLTGTNGAFNNSGLFGSDSNQRAAAEGLTNGLGALDMQQYNQSKEDQRAAVPILQQLFGASAAPSAAVGAVGAAQDANSQGILSGRADLATRQNNAWTDLIAKLTSAAAGNAAGTGTTTTNTSTQPQTPWWQSLGGLALQAL